MVRLEARRPPPRAPGVHPSADRAPAAASGAAEQSVPRRRPDVGLAVQGPRLAAARRSRDGSRRLAEALDRLARTDAGRRRDPDDQRGRGAHRGGWASALHERAPRADHLPVSRGSGAGMAARGRHGRSAETGRRGLLRRISGRPARPGSVSATARPGARARRRGRAGPRRPPRDAAAPPARRRGDSAVLDPFPLSVGRRRDRRHSEVRRLGQPGRLLGVAAAAGQRGLRRRRQPLHRAVGVRARSGLSLPGGLRGLRGGGRARGALRGRRATSWRRWRSAPLVDWTAARALKSEGIALAFRRFLRDEWSRDTGRARQLAAFSKANRHWLDDYALFSVWHAQFGRGWFDWPSGPRDRNPHALDEARREQHDAILRTKWAQWQLDLQWRNARRGASAFGVELMGDLPFVVGRRFGGRLVEPGALSDRPACRHAARRVVGDGTGLGPAGL